MTKTVQLFNCSTIQHKRGFTLIEILIATAIFGMVMLAAMGILSRLLIGQNIGSNQRVLQQSARLAMDTITRDIRTADSLDFISNPILTRIETKKNNLTKRYMYRSVWKNIILYDQTGNGQQLFPSNIQVTNFTLTPTQPVQPITDPQVITIDMTVQSTGNPPAVYLLRTTVTPRLYNWMGK